MSRHKIRNRQETEQMNRERKTDVNTQATCRQQRLRYEPKLKSYHAWEQGTHPSVQIKDGAEVILDQPVPVQQGQQKEMRGLSDCAQGAGSAAMR